MLAAPEPESSVEGALEMEVNDLSAFVSDPAVKVALGNSIAAMAGVPPSFVLVSVSAAASPSARRLSSLLNRRLQSGTAVIDYIIIIPASSPLHETTKHIGSLLASVEPETVSTLMEAEIGAQTGSDKYTLSVTVVAEPSVKIPTTTTSTTTTRPFEEEWGHLWDVTTVKPTDQDTVVAGPQLAVLLVFSLSGALIACTIAHWRLRKQRGECGKCWGEPCCGLDRIGWDEPALDELEERELPEDSCDEPDMEVDCFAVPFSDGSLPMCVKGKKKAGEEPLNEEDAFMEVECVVEKPYVVDISEGESLDEASIAI
jgi:hypothetical protein